MTAAPEIVIVGGGVVGAASLDEADSTPALGELPGAGGTYHTTADDDNFRGSSHLDLDETF